MNERVRFVAAMLESEESFVELCERFGISRKQGYRWKERCESGGVAALKERSRAPHNHPQRVELSIVGLLLAARRKHPSWGPRKLLILMRRHQPELDLPVASTVGEILRKNDWLGLAKGCGEASRTAGGFESTTAPIESGVLTSRDISPREAPLQSADNHRWLQSILLCCKVLKSTTTRPVFKVFERIFREFGLPTRFAQTTVRHFQVSLLEDCLGLQFGGCGSEFALSESCPGDLIRMAATSACTEL